MNSSTDEEKTALLESLHQKVKELEDRLGYKTHGLDPEEQDRLDALFHNAKRMRRFTQPTDT